MANHIRDIQGKSVGKDEIQFYKGHILIYIHIYMYSYTLLILFQENGPFLAGWDESSYLLPNKHSWTSNHNILYIDNPVGTGFSFTDNDEGYPTSDEDVAIALMEALRQFMRFLPSMVEGMIPSGTPLYAFGQSYGGAYVVSLSHLYLSYRENDREKIKDIWLKGIGIGNGFISPTDQSLYSEYVSNLGYVKESEFNELKKYDDEVVKSLKTSNYVRALEYSHKSLNYFVSKLMRFTNIYDFTFDEVIYDKQSIEFQSHNILLMNLKCLS